jgi:signal transduction histidine kinase
MMVSCRSGFRDDWRSGADFGHGRAWLGLKDRIEALGGRISLHSLPGAGVTLDIALPLSGPAGRHGKAESSGRT